MKKFFLIATVVLVFVACNDNTASTASGTTTDSTTTSPEDKEERNKETALASLKAFSGTNVSADSVFANADKDIIDYNTGEMPPSKGIDSSKAGLQSWLAAVPDYKGSDFMAVADGDYVMVYGTWTGTWKNDFMGMKATGKSFKVNDVDIFKFNDAGKMIEHRGVQSINEVARQIGMQMSEPPKQ